MSLFKCSQCGKPNPTPDKSRCRECASRGTAINRKRRQDLTSQGLCIDCRNPAEVPSRRCRKCLDSYCGASKARALILKREVLCQYGGAFCACCGEDEIIMLTLDHIDQNGGILRRAGEGSGSKIYQKLRREGYPPGFRVLCRNCNYAVYFDPDRRCPHRTGCFSIPPKLPT